jgi:hypothetical protein
MPEYIEYLQEEYDIVYFSVGAGLLTYSLNKIYESATFWMTESMTREAR